MPHQPYRSPITGRRRRVPQRRATPKSRSVYGLYTAEVGLRDGLQKCILSHNRAARRSHRQIRQLLLIKLILRKQQEDDDVSITTRTTIPSATSTAIITLPSSSRTSIDYLLRIERAKYRRYIYRITKWVRMDHHIFDVNPLEMRRGYLYVSHGGTFDWGIHSNQIPWI